MRCPAHLVIDEEAVGPVEIECDAARKRVCFHAGKRTLMLLEHQISSFGRYSSSINADPSQFVIDTAISSQVRSRFECSKVAQSKSLCLELQITFPAIPWTQLLQPPSSLALRRKRPREEASMGLFYGNMQTTVNPAFDKEFKYRVQHSIECQIEGTATPHQVFALQQPAIDFLKQIRLRRSAESIKLFSFETSASRKFLVSDIDYFYDKYMQTAPHLRHVYEIIQENRPCRLYFDLEFKPALNPHVDGDALVQHLKHLVSLQFYRKFHLFLDEENFVDLASTATDKFSRHLIVVAPNDALFINNLEAGQFVKEMLDDVTDENIFMVRGKDDTLQSFIDCGVYTRNRAFRLYLSSKYGSDRVLKKHDNCKFPANSEKEFFLSTLICPIGAARGTVLRCPLPASGKPGFSRTNANTTTTTLTSVHGASPYPLLDAFVVSEGSIGDVVAVIRSFQMVYENESSKDAMPLYITYTIINNRYCRNIGRHHKSNNVMYVVDMRMRVMYQKCHDPECRQFKSAPIPVPPNCFSQPVDNASMQ